MKPRRDKAKELFEMSCDLSVTDRELARQADKLTRRMNPPTRAFVIHFAGVIREISRKGAPNGPRSPARRVSEPQAPLRSAPISFCIKGHDQ